MFLAMVTFEDFNVTVDVFELTKSFPHCLASIDAFVKYRNALLYKKGCIKHVETNKMVEKLFHASLIRK